MTFGFLALLVEKMNFEMLGFVRELDQVSAQLIHTLFTWVSHGNKILKTYFRFLMVASDFLALATILRGLSL
jgi:hypothetical protein